MAERARHPLDDLTLAVRPRHLAEVHDLALLLVRHHAGPMALLSVVGVLPWALLDAWILSAVENPAGACWLLAVLAFAQAPLAVAPITCYLGQAMFSRQPRWTTALATAWSTAPKLLLVAFWRALTAAVPLLMPWSYGHLQEVLCLERQGLGSGWKRAVALTRVGHSREILHLLLAALTVVVAVVTVAETGDSLVGMIRHGDVWADPSWESLLPGAAVLPTVGLWLAMPYLAVVRFANYLDLRTRHEGWDLELDLRRAAGRLSRGGA